MRQTDWVKLLRGAASPGLRRTPLDPAFTGDAGAWLRDFRDSAGNRRRVDPFLLAHVLRQGPSAPEPGTADEPWLTWWHALATGSLVELNFEQPEGPLFPSLHHQGIETWTEGELCGLHALSWLGVGQRDVEVRLRSAARWLIDTIQPDNATGHPWGVHVFAWLSQQDGPDRVDADMYAQTLLHNALAGRSETDVFSAIILWDGAAWLERSSRSSAARP